MPGTFHILTQFSNPCEVAAAIIPTSERKTGLGRLICPRLYTQYELDSNSGSLTLGSGLFTTMLSPKGVKP